MSQCADKILSQSDKYKEFLISANIKRQDVEKHAEAYKKQSERQKQYDAAKTPLKMFGVAGLEWDKLQGEKNYYIALIVQHKIIADRGDFDDKASNERLKYLVQKTMQNREANAILKEKAPKLAEYFDKYYKPTPKESERMIDWKDEKLQPEWDKLRGLDKNEGKLHYLVGFHDIAKNKNDKAEVNRIYKTMDDLIRKIYQNKTIFGGIQKASPKLAGMFKDRAVVLNKERSRSRGRDR